MRSINIQVCVAGVNILAALLVNIPVKAFADPFCFEQASSALEKTYCEVKASGKGGSLPPFPQFKKNPANMQRLLLKKPARLAGIKIPDTGQPDTPEPVRTVKDTPGITTVNSSEKPAATAQTQPSETNPQAMDRCILQKNQIQCATSYYLLRTNLPNHELASHALSNNNKLVFPERHGGATDREYLSACYPAYIDRMLSIGLGDSTMSYTRFVAMWEEIQGSGEHFAHRFGQMFELLKKEKQTNAIRRRYSNTYPQHISQCMFLNSQTITCDNVQQNWVYQR